MTDVNKQELHKTLSILHLNVRSLRGKRGQLEAFIADRNLDVICLSEHWLQDEEICSAVWLENYNCVSHFARSSFVGGGVAIFVRNFNSNSINCFKLDSILNVNIEKCIEACGVRIPCFNLFIICVYRSPSGNFGAFLAGMESILQTFGKKQRVIIAGDFNVHFDELNRDTNRLRDLLGGFGYEQTIFEPTRVSSCLDNIFTNFSPDNLNVLNIDADISDHRAQIMSFLIALTKGNNLGTEINTFRPLTQRGMFEFYNLIEQESFEFVNDKKLNINQKFDGFIAVLEASYTKAFPQKSFLTRHSQTGSIPWFNEELKNMREHLHLLGEVSRQYKRPGDIELYHSYKVAYRHAIKISITNSNDNIVNSSQNPQKALWNIINKITKRKTCETYGADISPETFNDYFSNIAKDLIKNIPVSNNSDPFSNFPYMSLPDTEFCFLSVSFNEIRDIINHMKNKCSKDIFGLNIKLIKCIKDLIIIPLARLINLCFKESVFPNNMKRAVVVPVFKTGDRGDVCNYRPISLLPVISKIIEKAIALKMVSFFEASGSFTASQFGFRSGSSTVLGILDLVSRIAKSFEDLQYSAVLFCDLSKAFDCVDHQILLKKLSFYKFTENSIALLKSYLSGRAQVVRVGGLSSSERVLDIGVPQGSILGPILFLIYINDLPYNVTDVSYTLFADDTTISLSAGSRELAMERLLVAQERAGAWFDANRLLLNNKKTKRVLFALRDTGNINGDLECVKFLGVYIDPTLRWDCQVEKLSGRLRSSLFALRTLSECVSLDALRTAYHSLFHSVMSYSILAWGHSAHTGRVFGLQRKAVRIMVGLGYGDDCRQAFRDLKILTLPSQYILDNLIHIKTNESSYRVHGEVHGYETRQRDMLIPAYHRLGRCRNGPGSLAINFFNVLPHSLKSLPIKSFKIEIKKILLENAFYDTAEYLNAFS